MSTTMATVIERSGGITALAEHLGITHNSIYSWKRVPADRVRAVEALTGISRHDLRPDIFGPANIDLPKVSRFA